MKDDESRFGIFTEAIAAKKGRSNHSILVTFDDKAEYVSFVEHVYNAHDGRGLSFGVGINTPSVAIEPDLIKETADIFNYRLITSEDYQKADDASRGRKAWDPNDISFPDDLI